MKPTILALMAFFAIALATRGQQPSTTYRPTLTWVHLIDNKEVVKGELLKVSDSSVLLYSHVSTLAGEMPGQKIEYTVGRIAKIQSRRKSSVAIGAGAGLLSGILVGSIVGIASVDYDKDALGQLGDATVGVFVYSVYFGVIGTGLGAIIGTTRKTYPIDGSADRFNEHREKLARLARSGGN